MKWVGYLLLLVSGTAMAGDATLTWTAPTQRCDGSALTNLAGYNVFFTKDVLALPPDSLGTTITGLTPGTWHFAISSIDADGKRSDAAVGTKEVTSFVVAQEDVFTVVKRTDRFVLVKVGTIPVGTACLVDQNVNGKYAVPRALVQWAGLTRPDVVVASCH